MCLKDVSLKMYVSQRCIFKVRKFQLDSLRRFGMVEEKHEGGGGRIIRPPGKIGHKLFHLAMTFRHCVLYRGYEITTQQTMTT